MREDTIARIYADALMQAAEQNGERKNILEELESLALVLDEIADFQRFLESPQIDKVEKKKLIDRLFGDKLSHMTRNFLGVLLEKNRQYLLKKMVAEYKALDDEVEGISSVSITSARPVSVELEEEFVRNLEQALKKKIRLTIEVDPTLLGGITIRYQDRVLDGSVKSRLEDLKDRIKAKQLMEEALYED